MLHSFSKYLTFAGIVIVTFVFLWAKLRPIKPLPPSKPILPSLTQHQIKVNLLKSSKKLEKPFPEVSCHIDMSANYLSPFKSIKVIKSLEDFTQAITEVLINQQALGVDIENSLNTYDGFISLLQISFLGENGIQNYVFDILSIFQGIPGNVR
jgi:hypothetical protein